MRTNLDEIFEQYRRSDFMDRLNIYLQFPELRNEFLDIDQKETHPDFLDTVKTPSRGLNQIGIRIKRIWLRRR